MKGADVVMANIGENGESGGGLLIIATNENVLMKTFLGESKMVVDCFSDKIA